MKALKLIWLSDRYSLMMYGRGITGDEYFALPKGPVASAVRDILGQSTFLEDEALRYGADFIAPVDTNKYNYQSTAAVVTKIFSKSDIEIIDIIYKTYSHLDHYQLSELSHLFPEWKRHEVSLHGKQSSRFKIETEDFFVSVDDGYNLFNQSETETDISKLVYEEYKQISSQLK